MARWKEIAYPKIAAEATAADGVVFVVDEAGVRSEDHAGTTGAAVGATPPVRTTGARFDLNMILAISAQGALRFSVLVGTLAAAGFLAFLPRLLHDAAQRSSGPVFCIVDNHPVHRAKAVDRVVDSTQGALRLSRLPAYALQLNPDQWVWTNVKHDGVRPRLPKVPSRGRRSPPPSCAGGSACRTSSKASSATRNLPTSPPSPEVTHPAIPLV